MLFQEIVGVLSLKNTLIRSLQSGHIAHAQLFLGNEGSANLALALAYAQYLNCENPTETDACGFCPSCYKTQKLIHPDLHFVFPVTTTKTVSKDPLSENFLPDWRKFLLQNPYQNLTDWLDYIGSENKQPNISAEQAREIIKTLSLKTFEGKYKIMMIWQPECMNLTAANILLKILEEPPPQTIFLLVGNSADNILTTIISRTQLVKVPDFTDEEIKQNLVEKFGTDPEKSAHFAFLADGNLHKALMFKEETPDENLVIFRQWMRDCYSMKVGELLEFSEKFQKTSREEQRTVLEYGLQVFRECLIWNGGENSLIRLPEELKNFVQNFSKQMTEEKIEFLYKEFSQAIYYLERNANPRILSFDLALRIGSILR
jgi:DNA polymerase-3 subunit delta'